MFWLSRSTLVPRYKSWSTSANKKANGGPLVVIPLMFKLKEEWAVRYKNNKQTNFVLFKMNSSLNRLVCHFSSSFLIKPRLKNLDVRNL